MNDGTRIQLGLLAEIAETLDGAGVDWWLFGGWALDFHAGEVTRDHSDIEIFVWRDDIGRARDSLVERGFAAPPGLYPDEAQPFIKDGQEIGLWFIVADASGQLVTPGRWSDWPWPDGSFDARRIRLGEIEARVMSVEGLLDMKIGFAKHQHGAPLRDKDRADIERLSEIIGA